MCVKGNPECPDKYSLKSNPEILPEKQENNDNKNVEVEKNISALISYYENMPEAQFHQMMCDDGFFAQEFSDPVFEIGNVYNYVPMENWGIFKSSLISTDRLEEGIQSASSPFCSEQLLNKKDVIDASGNTGHIATGIDTQSLNSQTDYSDEEYFSCEEDFHEDSKVEDDLGDLGTTEVNGDAVLNCLYEISLSPMTQFPGDFVVEQEFPYFTNPEIEKESLVQTASNIVMKEDNGENSELGNKVKPSFDLEFEPHEIESHSTLYTNYLSQECKSIPKNVAQNGALWSILTDQVHFCGEKSNALRHKESKSHFVDPKELYFNADHNNVPQNYKQNEIEDIDILEDSIHMFSTGSTEDKNMDSDPKQLQAEQCVLDLDQRYDVMAKVVSEDDFDPHVCITTNYLWSEKDHRKTSSSGKQSKFDMGVIPIDLKSVVRGNLLDQAKTPVKALIDSGCTAALLGQEFYDKTPFLHQFPKRKMTPIGFRLGNDQFLYMSECVEMIVNFHGHVFQITAYLTPGLTPAYDMVIGQKNMYELEGGPSFGTMNFSFMKRSLQLRNPKEIHIKPGHSEVVRLPIKNCPPDFRNGHVICHMKTNSKSGNVATKLLPVKNKTVKIIMENNMSTPWVIPKNSLCGCADMRSVGYFHIKREVLQSLLSSEFAFLSEDETTEYFKLVTDDLCILNRMSLEHMDECNTRLKKRFHCDQHDQINKKEESDPWPWLDEDDPRRHMTDEEIIKTYVDLSDSKLTDSEKRQLVRIMLKYKEAFSLRDEIGTCPNMEVDLELNDERPFFIRPFPCSESDKDIIDKQMRKGCVLGILKRGMTSYSSPIMLIPRKQGGIPRIVTDFRHLNSRLVVLQPSIPLVRETKVMQFTTVYYFSSLHSYKPEYRIHTLKLLTPSLVPHMQLSVEQNIDSQNCSEIQLSDWIAAMLCHQLTRTTIQWCPTAHLQTYRQYTNLTISVLIYSRNTCQ